MEEPGEGPVLNKDLSLLKKGRLCYNRLVVTCHFAISQVKQCVVLGRKTKLISMLQSCKDFLSQDESSR